MECRVQRVLPVDYIQVGRKAAQLEDRMGWYAHEYAGGLAADALARGETADHEFWKAVEDSLKPRSEQSGISERVGSGESIELRAKLFDRDEFDRALAQIPAVEPDENDRL